jgi:hypothetical protein
VSVFYVCNDDDDEEEEAERERDRLRERERGSVCRRESTLCVSSWTNHPL